MFHTYARINIALVIRVIGLLVLIEAIFMLIPAATCLIYGESDYLAFLISIAAAAVTGGLMMCVRPKTSSMKKREGFLLTSFTWIFFSAFGMLPFLLGNVDINVSDAFFESMSGFTTTGASVLVVSQLSHGIILWRCLMQWIGGMGIILFTLAVVPMLNHSGGMQMFNAEVTGITHDKLRPRVSQTAKGLWAVYVVLTLLLFLFLLCGPMDTYESLCHAFSTMSTGGFSTRDESIGAWDSNYIDVVLIVFMFLGGVNFGLIYKAAHGEFKPLALNDSFKTYLRVIGLMMVGFVICILAHGQYNGWDSITIDPLFQIISTITSTGYTVNNFEAWGTTVLAMVFLMMFFGACAGSTSGGAKIDRMLFLVKNTRNEVARALTPNTIFTVRINGHVVAMEVVSKVIAFLCIYLITIVIGGIVLTALGIPLVDSFFSAFSCMSNTGLGAGVTGYGGSYDVVPSAGKWVLSFIMLIGRLEIFTVLVMFQRSFWFK